MKRAQVLAACALACRQSASPPGSDPASTPPANDLWDPKVLATDDGGPAAIAADDTAIYWADFGKPVVQKLARAGGAPVALYRGKSEIGGTGIGLDATGVYFIEGFDVMRVPKAGGAAVRVGGLDSLPARITADDDGAYSATNGTVARHAAKGGTTVLAQDGEIWDVGVDATHVYWLAQDGVKRVPKAGGKVERLAKGTFRFGRMLVTDHDVYWGDGVLENVYSVAKAGGPVHFVAHAWSLAGRQLVLDRGTLWALTGEGYLQQLDPSHGDVRTVAVGLARNGSADHFVAIAVAGADVFVASGGQTLVGTGPVVIDLTQPDPKLPQYTYSGEILTLPAKLPPKPIVEHRGEPQLAQVWFSGATTEYQDPANAVRWIEEYEQVIVPDVRAGKLALRVVGISGGGADERVAKVRAERVAQAIRDKLGGTPKVEVATRAGAHDHGDVQVVLDPGELAASMKP